MNISALASMLLAEDPLYLSGTDDEKETAARELITRTGGKADEIYISLVVREAEGRPSMIAARGAIDDDDPLAVAHERPRIDSPLLDRFTCATRLNDSEIASLLGISRPTVNLWRNGRSPERFTGKMRQILADVVTEQRAVLKTVLDEIERKLA